MSGLTLDHEVVLPRGSGPRHMVVHPSGHLHVVTEYSCELFTLAATRSAVDGRERWGLVAGTQVDLCFIGGVVHQKDGDKEPMTGVEVAIKGTGLFAKTDDRGRFGLGSLPPGPYTLIVWPAEGRPKEKAIQVPGASDEYDLAL